MSSVHRLRTPVDVLKRLIDSPPPEVEKYIQQIHPTLGRVLEGPVLQHKIGKKKPRKRYLFLCGSLLLITKPKGIDRFKMKAFIGLSSRKDVSIVTDSQYETPNVEFRVYGLYTYILFAPTSQDRDRWIQEMQKYIVDPPQFSIRK